MGCDLVVAVGRSTVDGRTLFGHNYGRPAHETQWLVLAPGRDFAIGERVRTQADELPQVRRTWNVLGCQSSGLWGYHQGINERGVAAGYTTLRTRLERTQTGLTPMDLVRLLLERASSARQAVDLLADLLARHGQPGESDGGLLVADAREAFAIETAGPFWVHQEVREVRALGDVCTIRQDWNRISPGLADMVIAQGWWPGDGSKIDFAGTLGKPPVEEETALRRWGRATVLLQEQNGRIDVPYLRRLLADHYEGSPDEIDPATPVAGRTPLCRHSVAAGGVRTAASLVADPGNAERLPLAWCAFGPPCASVYFPLVPAGELPEPFSRSGLDLSASGVWQRLNRIRGHMERDRERWSEGRDGLTRLQSRFDQDAEEFLADVASLRSGGNSTELARRAGLFMQHNLECFEEFCDSFLERRPAGSAVSVTSH